MGQWKATGKNEELTKLKEEKAIFKVNEVKGMNERQMLYNRVFMSVVAPSNSATVS